MFKYVIWNELDAESMDKAGRKKQRLESDGWILVASDIGFINCRLTYRKP